MHDGKVLAACMASRRAYDAVAKHVDPSELSPQFGAWWPLLTQWYGADVDATAVDVALLRERGTRHLPPAHQDTLLGWFDDLEPSVAPMTVIDHLLDAKRQVIYFRIQAACAREDNEELDAAYTALTDLSILGNKTSDGGSWDPTVEAIFDPMSEEGRIPIMPPELFSRVVVVRGDHIILFARPNMGKTLFWINAISYLAKNGYKVCVFENEDPLPRDALRTMANILDRPGNLVQANGELAHAHAMKRGMANIRWRKGTPGSVEEIDAWLEREKPDLVVVNQLRNLQMRGNADSMSSKLESLAMAIRNLAGKHNCVAISVTQAGDSASGKALLSMSDIDNSKTGIPGACDHIFALGATDEMVATDRVMFSFPKVKGPRVEAFMRTMDTSKSMYK